MPEVAAEELSPAQHKHHEFLGVAFLVGLWTFSTTTAVVLPSAQGRRVVRCFVRGALAWVPNRPLYDVRTRKACTEDETDHQWR